MSIIPRREIPPYTSAKYLYNQQCLRIHLMQIFIHVKSGTAGGLDALSTLAITHPLKLLYCGIPQQATENTLIQLVIV